jgi:molybdate transport system substrate-binding protein
MMRPTVLAALVAVALAAPARAQEVTISAAISTKDTVEELGRGFSGSRPGVTLRYNFGSSGELQQQIEAGAPVDLFISAAERQMDELEKKGLIVPETRRVFARNVLTVVTPADSRLDLKKPEHLLDPRVQKLVVGNPKTVPAGWYSRESRPRWGCGGASSRGSCSPRTSGRRSITSRAARSTRASST